MSPPPTLILTASKQIATNIKVMVIEVTSVIIASLSVSSKTIKQHTRLIVMSPCIVGSINSLLINGTKSHVYTVDGSNTTRNVPNIRSPTSFCQHHSK